MPILGAVVLLGAAAAAAAAEKTLTVASWGGAYAQSQQIAYYRPFQEQTGIAINSVYHGGTTALFGNGREYRFGNWDVVDVSAGALESGCRDGLLAPISKDALAPARDGTPAEKDFLAGALHECGVASMAWSSVIVYDKRAFGSKPPKTAADFFDLKRFPGKRALKRGAQYTLELALLADGVAPANVYSELATEAGLKRAFAVLQRIKDDVVWWTSSEEPLKLLADGKVAMATTFNGRAFVALVADNRALAFLWDGHIYTMDSWAIPKSSKNKDAALQFIAFATKPERLAEQAKRFPYGPVRKSALKMVGDHPEIDVDMSPFLPTSPANLKHALQVDAAWWLEHGDAVEAKFASWLSAHSSSGEDSVRTSSAEDGKEAPKSTVSP